MKNLKALLPSTELVLTKLSKLPLLHAPKTATNTPKRHVCGSILPKTQNVARLYPAI
jgi:hypothetical protein